MRWGVLGAARIAVQKVIPAMLRSARSEVAAIASRDAEKARRAAAHLGIARAYASYDELLADAEIEAIYNPLPNDMHVPWTIRAAEAGKHVLCEKPIALSAAEAASLLAVRDRTGVLVQEAFMVRSHPQWLTTLEIVDSGRIGEVRAIVGAFSFFNQDAANIRNVASRGGGAMMDIGCYLVHTARMVYRREPARVMGLIERDPRFGVDRLTSLMLDFGTAHAVGTCSTQMVPYQRITILGTAGRVEMQIPFNAPNDRPCRVIVDDGSDLVGGGVEVVQTPSCDQYAIQADLFSRAIREHGPAPYPLEDSIRNMAAIEAVFRSAASGCWEKPADDSAFSWPDKSPA